MKFPFVCACEEIEERKIYLTLILVLVKVGGNTFSIRVMASGTVAAF